MHKILLVDDDERILKSFSKRLRKSGYEVEVAESGEIAMGKLQTLNPDLIISDMRMPGMDGVELMKGLPKRDGFFPGKIIFTAFDDGEAIEFSQIGSGGVFRVEKDRWETDLQSSIARALEIRQLQVEAWKKGMKMGRLKSMIATSNNLSHQINNPLNNIFTAIGFIRGLPGEGEYIEKIHTAMHKIHRIVITLDDATRESGDDGELVEEVDEEERNERYIGH